MSESINARVNRLADGIDRQELQKLLTSMLTDLEALTAAVNQLRTDYNAATTPTTAAAVSLNTKA